MSGVGALPGRLLICVIGLYRVAISPVLPACCRYYPSCSEYAIEAVRLYGPARGAWLGLKRVLRCHPWAGGGIDPVPGPRAGGRPPRASLNAAGDRNGTA